MSYYKIINGIKMDGHLVDKADHAVAVSGDGRISRREAEAIIVAVTYGFGYNDVEEDTLNYIRDNYKWSEGTEAWFRNQIKSWVSSTNYQWARVSTL